MINFCMRGCAKTAGLVSLSFCIGVVAGLFLPIAAVAIIETLLLIFFAIYACLNVKKGRGVMKIVVMKLPKGLSGLFKKIFKMNS